MASVSCRPGFRDDRNLPLFQDQPRDLVGCILWLKAPQKVGRELPDGLTKGACNHPCVVVDFVRTDEQAEELYRICM